MLLNKYNTEVINSLEILCKQLDWDKLAAVLDSNSNDFALKVMISALIEARCPDKEFRDKYGITIWDEKLANIPVPTKSTFTNRATLDDFYTAFRLAEQVLKNLPFDRRSVNDIIRKYVNNHKIYLASNLNKPKNMFFHSSINDIHRVFGELTISNAEIKSHETSSQIANLKINSKKQRIENLQTIITHYLNKLFDFQDQSCKLYVSNYYLFPYHNADDELYDLLPGTSIQWQAKHLKIPDEANIIFNRNISTRKVSDCADILEELGLNIKFVCWSNFFGQQAFIQTFVPLNEFIKSLEKALLAKNETLQPIEKNCLQNRR